MFINKYHYKSFFKRILENKLWVARFIFNWILNGGKTKTILFYPEFPNKRMVLSKILKENNINLTNNPKLKHSLVIDWQNETKRKRFDWSIISNKPAVNSKIDTIGKYAIDEIHQQVFGYCVNVNPLAHQGKMVLKSDANAMHDGKVIEGPIAVVNKQYVYQLVIDNTAKNNQVLDYRVPIIGDEIPFVYLKYRPIETRFSNINSSAKMVEVKSALNVEEQQKITAFCKRLNIDYAELDVLRDNASKLIYIVDVNPTPWGPPNHLEKQKVREVKRRLFAAFERQFL
jgi:hypothetical protein